MPGQPNSKLLSNLFRNVPFVTSLEVSPFLFGSSLSVFVCFSLHWSLILCLSLVLTWSLALPGAKPCEPAGRAFRAKRRARPTTAPRRQVSPRRASSRRLDAPPSATGGQPEAPTSASLDQTPEQLRDDPGPSPPDDPGRRPGRAAGSLARAAPDPGIPSPSSRPALPRPPLDPSPAPSGDSALPAERTGSRNGSPHPR